MGAEVTKESYGNHPCQYNVIVRGRCSVPDKLAFYFHGGGWTFGRPETFIAAAIPWLAAGFTVVLPSYRRLPRFGMANVVADCRRAIDAVASPAVGQIHLGGISAGAQLAALLALRPEVWTNYAVMPSRVLCCAGPLCLTRTWPQWWFRQYSDFDPVGRIEAAQRLEWLLLHGTADRVVHVRHSRHFRQLLSAHDHQVRLLELPGGDHLDAGRWIFGGPGRVEVTAFIAGAAAGAKEGRK